MGAAAPATARGSSRALDEAIRLVPAAWFRASPIVYWCDLAASATVGWGAFAAAVGTSGAWRVAFLTVATASLYRAVLFIHEITHRAARDVPMFKLVWNAIIGVPLLIPSFLYEGVHTDHHRQRCYGTDADPEYMPYGRRRPIAIIVSLLLAPLAPLAFALRFGVLAPLSWIVPPLGRFTRERASALAINAQYVRRTPFASGARLQEAAACALVWSAAWLWRTGRVSTALIACWAIAAAAASLVNAIRTLAAHRYDNDAGELTMVEQLLDSYTIAPRRPALAIAADLGRVIVAPVGLRYHALHHWIPSLPYHNLGRAHRLLVGAIARDAPYRSTIAPGFAPAIRDLVRRSRTQS
ncbi:MAG TPA: fatty acid desaturase [Vicinamibacterales bacterium]|nr:fatty acid desaturase [Vicinamibacterales bacterium]